MSEVLETSALATTNGQLAHHVTTSRAMLTAQAIQEQAEQRRLIKDYVHSQMVPNTDFGVIPGTEKPTLLKPGAEKLTELFHCTPEYELIEKIEDWDKGFFHYLFRVRIIYRETGGVVAEGFGSANSKEGRYRWRNANRKCPECGKETIIKGKAEYGGGWLCFKKKGGCGAKFGTDDQAIAGQECGRIENDDPFTYANTILKMAKKRALVDGSIALARCSDIFTQDVEDIHGEDPEPRQEESRQERRQEPPRNGQPAINREAVQEEAVGLVKEMADLRGKSWDDAYWAICRHMNVEFPGLEDMPDKTLLTFRNNAKLFIAKNAKQEPVAAATEAPF